MERTIQDLIDYILNSNTNEFNVYALADKWELTERVIREAFYRLREKGIISIRKDDFYILITNENREHYRDEVNAFMEKQRKAALTSISRYNKMVRALPEENQLWEEI